MVQQKIKLQETSSSYKLEILPEVERKIRWWCSKSPDEEWSGVLFYSTEGSFENNDLVITAKDFVVLNIGNAVYTEFDEDERVAQYIVMNDLIEYYCGLIHSHNKMASFFSGTDDDTLSSEGSSRNHFLSLIVNNAGAYTAAIALKIEWDRTISCESSYHNFFGVSVKGATKVLNDKVVTVEKHMLDIHIQETESVKISIPQGYKFDHIDENGDAVFVPAIEIEGEDEIFKELSKTKYKSASVVKGGYLNSYGSYNSYGGYSGYGGYGRYGSGYGWDDEGFVTEPVVVPPSNSKKEENKGKGKKESKKAADNKTSEEKPQVVSKFMQTVYNIVGDIINMDENSTVDDYEADDLHVISTVLSNLYYTPHSQAYKDDMEEVVMNSIYMRTLNIYDNKELSEILTTVKFFLNSGDLKGNNWLEPAIDSINNYIKNYIQLN